MKTVTFYRVGRLYILAALVLVWFVVLGARLVQLHVIDRPELLAHLEQNRNRFEELKSRRGDIVDVRGNLLATTRSLRDVGVDPTVLRPQDEERWSKLAELLDMPLEELRERMQQRFRRTGETFAQETVPIRWNLLQGGVSEDTYLELMNLRIHGVYGIRSYERTYPHNELASHVIGFINREARAVQGVEHWLDFYLTGRNGWREGERDGLRRELSQFRHREVPPVDGLSVQLTIDLIVQSVVEQEIARLAEEYDPKGISIIVSEAKTGRVLGLGNYPNFNLNEFGRSSPEQLRMRAITDVYEPGSVFKIVAIAGALNEGLIDPESIFDCSLEQAEYRGRLIRMPRDVSVHNYRMMTVREITMRSSNRGAALIGMKLGSRKMYDYSRAFGFGQRTGFPLLGEVGGTLHQVRNWDGLTITRLPIGHAVSATALQTHFAMSVIANDGKLMVPQIVERIHDRQGNDYFRFEPKLREQVVSPEAARTLAEMLREAVGPGGTGPRAAIAEFEVAGKTGTTQKIVNGRYSSQHHVASFVGFFPASNPELVITVIVDEPTTGATGYGGTVAAPSFRRIAEPLIQYLRITPPVENNRWMALEEQNR